MGANVRGADGGFAIDAFVTGIDVAGEPVMGVDCAWTASRPVTITPGDCGGAHVTSDRKSALALTCIFDGRVLGTVNLAF